MGPMSALRAELPPRPAAGGAEATLGTGRVADDGDVASGSVVVDAAKALWVVSMTLLAIVGGAATATLPAVGLFLVSTGAVLLLGHSLGLHRRLVHASFDCPLWLERVLVYAGTLTGISGPLGLLRTHDLRDFAQRQPRCHDFFAHRRSFLVDAAWQLGGRLALDRPPTITLEPRIADDPFYRFLERTWPLHQLPWAIACHALGGWGLVFWGVCARVAACNLGHFAVGHLAHREGARRWRVRGAAVQGTNVPFCALVTMGESWHNNHHAFPGSARLGLRPGEWDPGWWLLRSLEAAGLAWNLRTPADLAPRPELEPVPGR